MYKLPNITNNRGWLDRSSFGLGRVHFVDGTGVARHKYWVQGCAEPGKGVVDAQAVQARVFKLGV